MKMNRRMCLFGGLAAMASGCATPRSQRIYPALSFSHLPPLRLNVARIDHVAGYRPPGKEPFVDHLFPDIPVEVAMRWGRDRLLAVGAIGDATFTVKDASAVVAALPRTTGMVGLITQDQSERCDLRIAMSLEAYQPMPSTSGYAEVEAKQSRTFAEDATSNEREAAWYEMTEKAMRDLDRAFTKAIRANLGRLVVS